MSPKPEIINPLEYPSWDDLLLSTNGYSFFHTSAWARVLHETYHYKPLYFSIIGNGRLLLSIPVMEVKGFLNGKRGVSLPFTDCCEPIIAEDMPFKDILGRLIEYGREAGWKFIEIRGGGDLFGRSRPSQFYYVHDMDLVHGEKRIFSSFKGSTKRNIKKAIREGVRVSMSSSIESIRDFYRLNCMTRKSHGLPPQPYFFFKKIHEHIISKGHGFVALASHEGKTIAGAVYFHFGKRSLYKYGASDIGYQYLRANNLVMWEAIKRYAKEDYQSFSFGKTEPGNTGLRQFKAGWGAKEKKVYYYRYSFAEDAFVRAKPLESGLHNGVFNRLPIPLLRLMGAIAYKYQG
jgi:hypothetical protein